MLRSRTLLAAMLAVAALALAACGGDEPTAKAPALPAGLSQELASQSEQVAATLQAGPHRVVSLMTREAADELQLAPGVLAVAAVKATNVVVELPAPATSRG